MTWAQRIWQKVREAWGRARLVAGGASAIERATHAYINSREFREARAL